ncbi:hypothetical protein [Vibrio phage phiKT1024]|nr:hypothetical protein [Vibrio phage phiKT1024]
MFVDELTRKVIKSLKEDPDFWAYDGYYELHCPTNKIEIRFSRTSVLGYEVKRFEVNNTCYLISIDWYSKLRLALAVKRMVKNIDKLKKRKRIEQLKKKSLDENIKMRSENPEEFI